MVNGVNAADLSRRWERPSGQQGRCRLGGIQPRDKDHARVLGLIKQFWLESGSAYGYRKITRDLRDLGRRVASTGSRD